MIHMSFRGDRSFYRELRTALRNRRSVQIATDFTSMDQVPDRLREIFGLDAHGGSGWVMPSGLFRPRARGALSAVGLQLRRTAAVAAGAGAGLALGGPIGGLLGGGIGFAAGTVAAGRARGRFRAEVVIDGGGKMCIHVEPI